MAKKDPEKSKKRKSEKKAARYNREKKKNLRGRHAISAKFHKEDEERSKSNKSRAMERLIEIETSGKVTPEYVDVAGPGGGSIKEERLRAIENGLMPYQQKRETTMLPGGRQRSLVFDRADYDLVFKLAAIGCSKQEIATFLNISYSSFRNILAVKMEQRGDAELARAYWLGTCVLKRSLRKAQVDLAVAGLNPQMLIWLGKQMLDQTDSPTVVVNDNREDDMRELYLPGVDMKIKVPIHADIRKVMQALYDTARKINKGEIPEPFEGNVEGPTLEQMALREMKASIKRDKRLTEQMTPEEKAEEFEAAPLDEDDSGEDTAT